MRIVLIGAADARTRFRHALAGGPFVVAAEVDTIAAARAMGHDADAWLMVPAATDSSDADRPAFDEQLTPREMQVLELLAEGLPNKAIARRLDISDQTVKFHVASIGGKLGAANRTDTVRRAVRRGILAL